MQHHKCCYCEDYIPDSGQGKHVEHFRPKSKFKELTYDWNNLLLACAACNGAKLNEFPLSNGGEPFLLNPADPTLDPEEHIEFLVSDKQAAIPGNGTLIGLLLGIAIPRAHSLKGEESIRIIKLSGSHHVKKRKETLDRLLSYYTSLLSESKRVSLGNGDSQEVNRLTSKLQEAVGADKRYAGLSRTFSREYQLSKFGIRAHP